MTATATPAPASGTPPNRWMVSLIVLVIIGSSALMAHGFDIGRANNEERIKIESAYILKNNCVVASMDGRFASNYRCDLPEQHYLSAAQLNKEARALAGVSTEK